MKRIVLALCVVLLLALPVLAVEPLTDLELASASYDAENDRFWYNGQWYDGSGYPLYTPEAPTTEVEDNTSNSDETEADTEGETETGSDELPTPAPDDAALIHQEDTSGNTQVNVFAIQTDDETGGTWIQGGSGESPPYNASGIASVDWAWIADVVLFAILVLCFFKIVAGVMKRV